MDTADHTSNWFDKQHFEHNELELCRLQPSTLDRIWISQHTQTNPVTEWLLLKKQEPWAFSENLGS
jgi:hypothetical protein